MNLKNYPEELEGLFAKISDLLAGRGVEVERAAEAAFSITEFMREEWGGVAIYFKKPKGRGQKPGEWAQEALLAVPCVLSAEPAPDPRDYHALLAARSAEILSDMGLAAGLAADVADMVRDDWTGQAVYVNKGLRWRLARRDYAIWRAWDGSYAGKMALMKQNDISEVRFYQIVAAVRRREFRRTQPVLPGVVGE